MSANILKLSDVIKIHRGDSVKLTIRPCLPTDPMTVYELQKYDNVYLGITRPNEPFECAVIKKRFGIKDIDEDGLILASINSDETVDLRPGVYYYCVKLVLNNGADNEEVYTIQPRAKFVVMG